MSMDQNPDNAEFLKEFAQDCQDILNELGDLLSILRNQQEDGKPVLRRTFEHICRDLTSIQNSAEFLGLSPIYQICLLLADYLENLPTEEYFFSRKEVDTFSAALACLGDFINRLGAKGVLGDVDQETDWVLEMIHAMVEGLEQPPVPKANSAPAPVPVVIASPPATIKPPSFDYYENIPDEFQIQITPEMLATYITEADEHLEQTESCLLGLEKNLNDHELLDSAFRGVHTFKGNSGLFNFAQLEKLGHEFESILENYKSAKSAVEPTGISLMLKVLDALKSSVHQLPEGNGQVRNFEEYLRALQDYQVRGYVQDNSPKRETGRIGEILIDMGAIQRDDLDQALSRQSLPPSEVQSLEPEDMSEFANTPFEELPLQSGSPSRKKSATQNIRVDLYKLDSLMNLVGELIIAENTVTHNPDLDGYDFQNFKKASLQLNRISRELQDISLSLRMVPIDATFHRMVRVVRDVSHKQGKDVDLVIDGEDTEIDKSVVESLAGPLLHIIRNAIDHGIEKPDKREELGKPRTGTIHLRAFHEGGEVVIEIRDDGRGMDPEKILAKAREKGMIGPDTEFHRTQDIIDLIFEPGFSTADQITDISGRGVGMDVVKRNIEAIKGRVHIHTVLGKGSSVSIRIPLTLAIIEGMLTRVGNQLFTIPLLSIRESLRTEPHQISRTVDGSEMIKIRDRLVPTVRLHRLFDVKPDHKELTDGILVVVDHERQQLCLFTDEILGQYQTVIKGLSNFMGNVRGISGTSIMSNGDISLILDIGSLVAFAHEQSCQVSKSKK